MVTPEHVSSIMAEELSPRGRTIRAVENFADRLEYLVQRSGLSESAWCRKVGVARSYVYMVRSGKIVGPTARQADKIAQAEGLDVQWLVSGNGTPPAGLAPPVEVDDPLPDRQRVIAMARRLAPNEDTAVLEAAITAFRGQEYAGARPSIDELVEDFRACVRLARKLQRGLLEDLDRDPTDAEREAFD